MSIFEIKFNNQKDYKIYFIRKKKLTDFWIKPIHENIITIVKLNTYHDIDDDSTQSRDLIVMFDRVHAVLWEKDYVFYKYQTRDVFHSRSELNSNRLSIFDSKTRKHNYWYQKRWEPLVNVLDIRALVYNPMTKISYAIGKTEFCLINVRFSTLNVKVCKKLISFS